LGWGRKPIVANSAETPRAEQPLNKIFWFRRFQGTDGQVLLILPFAWSLLANRGLAKPAATPRLKEELALTMENDRFLTFVLPDF
jgi:hypothetical protein